MANEEVYDEFSPLDMTLERVGMGYYQWKLLILCGFGWLNDSMWLQSIAIILPRVKIHFGISDKWIGLLSTSTFFGMMIGAWMWGSFSDSYGRRNPFNGTLFMTSIFGLVSGFAPTFNLLCLSMFFLGIGVGGSMPTDGTLFIENIPKTRHYLLTALSTFFSLGAVISSLLGLTILPSRSCPEPTSNEHQSCDLSKNNQGWRYMLVVSGILTLLMFLSRVLFFRIMESPKYLIASGRSADAIIVLEEISAQNGVELIVSESDLIDQRHSDAQGLLVRNNEDRSYRLIGEHHHHHHQHRRFGADDGSDSGFVWIKSARIGWLIFCERLEVLMSPELRTKTILIWSIWIVVAFGYTSFNVFLPAYMEKLQIGDNRIEDTMKEYLLYTLAGFPGSLIGTWMVETRLGRRNTMVVTTLGTGLSILSFLKIGVGVGARISSMIVSLLATIMCFTPELFPPSVRGTGYGISSALSRLSGMIAPIVVGRFIAILNIRSVLWISIISFFLSTVLMIKLSLIGTK
ncbi:major facilitator superfamily domain-containing protein [Phakopsora pachyrhizi]|uniref:Major facilitator superfamily domain-containing protein n=1 Tax=Phakopsora pachyrhizi TaxID=170000 RepID=A0AAV0AJD8_PHAPC|nr:major facilitator superfamily domain-containing protein [Phakopsora pachyrhizi]CAH7668600.1 major facilitator superfamily domain-containing protein [Phakopsora pachyrhizi]